MDAGGSQWSRVDALFVGPGSRAERSVSEQSRAEQGGAEQSEAERERERDFGRF